MSNAIPAETRLLVAERASHLCEYCLIHEDDTFYGCQVDHIVSVKHGGLAAPNNLAYSCTFCNRHKGSDLGSILEDNGPLVRFFNPRVDVWHLHFRLDGAVIRPETSIARVTERILKFNHMDRIIERTALIEEDRYPSPAAHRLAYR